MIWNTAFWPNADLRKGNLFTIGDYTAAFDEALARLYEGMVLLPMGFDSRVQNLNFPGESVALSIEVTSPGVECRIDQNLPAEHTHVWRRADISLEKGKYDFEFRNFFDWDQLGHRDFLYVEVLIRRMDPTPDATGHHALIPAAECSAWVITNDTR